MQTKLIASQTSPMHALAGGAKTPTVGTAITVATSNIFTLRTLVLLPPPPDMSGKRIAMLALLVRPPYGGDHGSD